MTQLNLTLHLGKNRQELFPVFIPQVDIFLSITPCRDVI